MPERRTLLAALPLLAWPGAWACAWAGVQALPPELRDSRDLGDLPGARLQGQGRFTFLGLHVYDARLWAAQAPVSGGWPTAPLALELTYARAFKGTQIAERSLQEMKRLADVPEARADQWLARMRALFPDVQAGDRLLGLHLPGTGARFFFNGQLRGELPDADFARLFFGIWLADKTSEPALRDALLGRPR